MSVQYSSICIPLSPQVPLSSEEYTMARILPSTFSFLKRVGQWKKEKNPKEQQNKQETRLFQRWATFPCRIDLPLQKGCFFAPITHDKLKPSKKSLVWHNKYIVYSKLKNIVTKPSMEFSFWPKLQTDSSQIKSISKISCSSSPLPVH